MRTTDLTTTGGNDQFYPTPSSVAEKMLVGVDFTYVQSVLEPSAGKGDLIQALMRVYLVRSQFYAGRYLDIDACEIDPYLRQILKYNFSDEKRSEILNQKKPLDCMLYSKRSQVQMERMKQLENEADIISKANLHIVHDDFLTYRTFKRYQLILMNPPFADGDKHLLKAIEMQRDGGIVICLLNAETIRNPYTTTRQLLKKRLDELGAAVEFIEDAFSRDAERKASVDVAIVKVIIPIPTETEESTIWDRMKQAEAAEVVQDAEIHDLVAGDFIERAIQYYNTEVAATMELVREYMAMVPYMSRKLNAQDDFDKQPILSLTVGDDNYIYGFDLNKYLRTVRLKYWTALLTNKEFIGRLTSNLQETYRENVDRMANYEFSAFNIKQIAVEMNASITKGVQDAIFDLFEKMTAEHSWYPECSQNIHYFNGWATNKAHKIGKKVILPTYVFEYSYGTGNREFCKRIAYAVISDLEKVFDYLGGKRPEDYDLDARLTRAESGSLRNIELAYFKVDFYKKGTMHIKFLPETMPLVDRLNIYVARNRNWLPPSYGKTVYASMSAEERAVVDSFHGDGTEGSGIKEYAAVMASSSFYLEEPTKSIKLLSAAT